MSRIIAIANHKGGVGKTTSVASIGAALANTGENVLLIDLDAQANLTESLLKEPVTGETIYDKFIGEAEGLETRQVVKVKENLYIVPSCLDMAAVDIALAQKDYREYILKRLIETTESEKSYDYILLDCPPSLGIVTINAFTSADYVIVPLAAEALPFKGLTMIEGILSTVKANLNRSLNFLGLFITRWEGRNLNKLVEGALQTTYGEKMFKTKIRNNISIAEAPLTKEDIFTYAKNSRGAKDYSLLADELIEKIWKAEENR